MARELKDVTLAMDGFQTAVAEAFAAQETLTLAQAKTTFKAFALDVFNRTREDTPWLTGFARSGWRIMVDEDEYSVAVTFWNGVVYIVPLEYGHSQKAPDGMLRRNLDAARDRLRQARKELLGG